MKTLEEYMNLKYRIELVEDPDEGGWVVSYPDLAGCISIGETLEDAVKNGEDARREWTNAMLEEGRSVPEPFDSASVSDLSFSEALVSCMKAKGMTMKAASEALSIPYRTVQDWKAGRSCPKPYMRSAILQQLSRS